MSSETVLLMLTLRNQIKLYHWQTMSFARHKGTDELVEKLDGNIDKFVEVYMGKRGRPKVGHNASLKIRDYHDKEAPKLLQEAIAWLSHDLPKLLKKGDTDLLNIRDEIVGDLNQALYLFTLA